MSTDNPYASPTAERTPPILAPHLEPPQSVSFQLTEEEVLASLRHIHGTNRTVDRHLRKRRRTLFILSAIMALLSLALWRSGGEAGQWIALMFGMMSAIYCILAVRLKARSMKAWSKYARESLADEETLFDRKLQATLFEEGIQFTDDDGHSFRKWRAVPRVEVVAGQLLVYQTSASVNTIPGRAFYDEAAFEGYAALAQRLWSAAHVEPVGENGEVSV